LILPGATPTGMVMALGPGMFTNVSKVNSASTFHGLSKSMGSVFSTLDLLQACVFDFTRSGDDDGLLHIAIGQAAHGGKARGGI